METVIWVSNTDNKFQVHTGTKEKYFRTATDIVLNFTVCDENLLYWISAVANRIEGVHEKYSDAVMMMRTMEENIRKGPDKHQTETFSYLIQSSFDKAFDEKCISVLNAILEELCNMYLKIRSNTKPIEG